jgi:hypothetical protein
VRLGSDLGRSRPREKRKKGKNEVKKADRWAFNGIFPNMLFYTFCLWDLFCASNFATRKYEFGKLNSAFSARLFTGYVRDALIISSNFSPSCISFSCMPGGSLPLASNLVFPAAPLSSSGGGPHNLKTLVPPPTTTPLATANDFGGGDGSQPVEEWTTGEGSAATHH